MYDHQITHRSYQYQIQPLLQPYLYFREPFLQMKVLLIRSLKVTPLVYAIYFATIDFPKKNPHYTFVYTN